MTLDEEVAAIEKAASLRAKELYEFVTSLDTIVRGVDVTITAKWPRRAHGRKGVIRHVSFFDEKIIYSLEFYRKDGLGYLDNKPSWTRSCYQRKDFEFC